MADEGARRGGGVRAARADGEDPLVGRDDVARPREEERLLPVGDDEERLEGPERLLGPPVGRELDRGPLELAAELLELPLEPGEEGERVGRRPGEAGEDGAAGEAAVNIESSLESVETILGAVLDISRLDAGAMKPEETVFRLDGLLRQIGTDFQPMAAAKGLELVIVPSSLWTETDRNLLRRLVQNLVSNAVKYTRRGRILVGVRRRGEDAELQVIDTGIGIAPDKLNTVFREFTRLEEGAREAQGLGLGLSIVDRIARVLRLEIRISSDLGRGTRFSVLLPVKQAQEMPKPAARRAPRRASATATGLAVACIDKGPRVREGGRFLREGGGGGGAPWAGSADIGGGATAMPRPDIILADYHLDGETGLDAAVRPRALHGESIPAVLVTADRTAEVRTAAAALDVPVINKPVKPAALRSVLARLKPLAPAPEQSAAE